MPHLFGKHSDRVKHAGSLGQHILSIFCQSPKILSSWQCHAVPDLAFLFTLLPSPTHEPVQQQSRRSCLLCPAVPRAPRACCGRSRCRAPRRRFSMRISGRGENDPAVVGVCLRSGGKGGRLASHIQPQGLSFIKGAIILRIQAPPWFCFQTS